MNYTSPRKFESGSKWDEESRFIHKANQFEKDTKEVEPKPKEVPSKPGNTVAIGIYMEAQCPDTTRFITKQLIPTWNQLRTSGRLQMTIVPFGKARCQQVDNDFKCDCQHGERECELNQLMNCAIDQLVYPDLYIPIIGCIQGKTDLNNAYQTCIEKNKQLHPEKLLDCAKGTRGRHLLALAGQKTVALNPALTFVPWVMLDGERNIDAFYALNENVCKKLEPRPQECNGVPIPQ
jgi:interferon gamma-inducible protein 30